MLNYISKTMINKKIIKNGNINEFEYNDNEANKSANEFTKIGYGYDTNDNKTVELFIDSFNYAVFLSSKGVIQLPLKNTKIKIPVDNILTGANIDKLITSVLIDDIEIK